jgi:hypothetical protein
VKSEEGRGKSEEGRRKREKVEGFAIKIKKSI